jgi:hypothetical protein
VLAPVLHAWPAAAALSHEQLPTVLGTLGDAAKYHSAQQPERQPYWRSHSVSAMTVTTSAR